MFSSGATERASALTTFEEGLVACATFDMRDATERVNSQVPNRHIALASSTSATRANPKGRATCVACRLRSAA